MKSSASEPGLMRLRSAFFERKYDPQRCVTKESVAGGLRDSWKFTKGRFLGNIFIFILFWWLSCHFFLDKELVQAFACFVLAICNN